jgi:hypothetical protein
MSGAANMKASAEYLMPKVSNPSFFNISEIPI